VSLKRQIRRYGRELLAAIALIAIGLATAAGILIKQSYNWPWEDFYEIKAEFVTGQAVTPGQGQEVTVSGVKVGDISGVELEDGQAVVTLQIEKRYAPIYNDAQMLLRPRTGLKDMQVQLDPGTEEAGEIPEGGTLPQVNTLPDVNPEEVLATLDADTRAWFTAAVDSLGTGLRGNGGRLRKLLITSQPTVTEARKITRTLAGRRREIARLVHNLNLVAGEAGRHEDEIERTISWSSVALGALAREDDALSASLARLPGTLDAASSSLRHARPLLDELEPAARDLTPALRALRPALHELRPLIRETTPIVRDRLRPLVSSTIPVLSELNPAAKDLGTTLTELPPVVEDTNYIVNALLHNPPGDEEGYAFWTAWFLHNGASMLSTQDAHGSAWRGLALFSCSTLQQLQTFIPLSGLDLQIPDPATLPGC
jgi:phospholipid/cholesterol/gamma-HCH transport system substrate-binding protein